MDEIDDAVPSLSWQTTVLHFLFLEKVWEKVEGNTGYIYTPSVVEGAGEGDEWAPARRPPLPLPPLAVAVAVEPRDALSCLKRLYAGWSAAPAAVAAPDRCCGGSDCDDGPCSRCCRSSAGPMLSRISAQQKKISSPNSGLISRSAGAEHNQALQKTPILLFSTFSPMFVPSLSW